MTKVAKIDIQCMIFATVWTAEQCISKMLQVFTKIELAAINVKKSMRNFFPISNTKLMHYDACYDVARKTLSFIAEKAADKTCDQLYTTEFNCKSAAYLTLFISKTVDRQEKLIPINPPINMLAE